MVMSILDSVICKIKEGVEASNSFLMAHFMLAIGLTTWLTVVVVVSIQMAKFMKVNGRTIRNTVKVNTHFKIKEHTRVLGPKINKTDRGKKLS